MPILKRHILIIAVLVSATFPASAFAAVNIPGTADPSRVREQIAPPPAEVVAPEVQSAAPVINLQQAPPGAEKINFVLTSLQIEGMTVYKQAEVAPLYQKMIGQKISLVDIYDLVNQLTTKYRNDGYILTQVIVPPQKIKDGRVTLRAVEGYIDEIRIQNKTTSTAPSYYAVYGDLIREVRPMNEKVLEKYMLLLNDLPGITATSVLSPSPSAPGASDLTIVIEHKPYDASVETDNRGSLYIGPEQYNGTMRLNNIFGHDEGITVQVAVAPDNMYANIFGLTYPLGHMGTMLNLNASITRTHPGSTLAQFDIRGMTHDYYISVTHPFIRSRSENLSGTFKLEYFNTYRTDNLGGDPVADRLRIERFGFQYQNADRFHGMNTLSTEFSNGIDALNASQPGDANMSQAEGDPQFFKATFEATRAQRLSEVYELYAAITGQKSANKLLSSELFGVGGAGYGSAYDSSEITGKDGIAGRMELRANPTIELIQRLQPYAFYDIGKVWDPQNTAAANRIMSIASAGIGLRAVINDDISGSLEAAKPLTRPLASNNSSDWRLFYMLTAKF